MQMVTMTITVGVLDDGPLKRWFNKFIFITSFRILARAFSGVITYHNRQNAAKPDGICVANHTTPVDVVVLACDNCYSYVSSHKVYQLQTIL